MKKLTASLALAFSFIVSPAYAWDINKMNAQIDNTNVVVGGVCSGTIISKEDRLVLTAYHCINDLFEDYEEDIVGDDGVVKKVTKRRKIPLEIWTNKIRNYEVVSTVKYSAKIVASEAKNDIALLQISDTDFVPSQAVILAPDTYQYKRGLRIYAVGNPGIRFDNSVSEGIIAAPMRSLDFGTGAGEFKMFQHSATTIGGNSGGSILNDDGELIGTVTGGIPGAAIGFAIPVKFTKDMLKKAGFTKIIPATDNKPVSNAINSDKGPQ
jgi:S1-C subfamily serine protease